MKYNKLTKQEENIILNKGTEQPYSGKYWNHKETGVYVCKRCNAPLFKSDDKFDSFCGWPGFDDNIPGSVIRQPDADGNRTEIICANCEGHLGHVFMGENFTSKNTRHCVNSISMKFIPDLPAGSYETVYLAGGCFWGVEYFLKEMEGVISTSVGFIGGKLVNPTYQEVCEGTSGYAEAVEVIYDPGKISYEKLAKLFFEIHDFTQLNRQGPDIGEQYRSEIFYTSKEQKEISEKLISLLENKGYKVATKLSQATKYWKAENYHQDYYSKKGTKPYCHIYKKIFE